MNFRIKETPFEIKFEGDWKKVKNGWYVSYICNKCNERHIKRIDKRNRKNTCFDPSFSLYKNEETPFIIQSEEDWKKVKSNWWVSYICNMCGKQHVKKLSSVNCKNTCLNKVSYSNKETPFEIRSEEDWKKVKNGWYVSYICNKCNERHIKRINKRNRKNTCFDPSFSLYKNEETPFIIQSEEDWKKVKSNWWVSYICNMCGKRHIKKIDNRTRKNTCLNKVSYSNKETPFEIKFEGDWKKVKAGWYVSYICNICGEKHVKKAVGPNHKNTCLNKTYFNKDTPFEIQSEEDWKKVKLNWYVSYICNKCGKRHIKKIDNRTRKNTCFDPSFSVYKNKDTPFEIQSEEDWKKVKSNWWVSYICNKCGERHVKRISDIKTCKNTCRKSNNIKYTYRENYIDKYVFAF